jgi:hypothetical protein
VRPDNLKIHMLALSTNRIKPDIEPATTARMAVVRSAMAHEKSTSKKSGFMAVQPVGLNYPNTGVMIDPVIQEITVASI